MNTNKTNFALRAFVRGATVLAACAGVAATAQPSSQIDVSGGRADASGVTRSRLVATSDLNLADRHGLRRLDQRISYAAGQVCDGAGMYGVRPPKDYVRCYGNAVEGARAQVQQRLAAGDGAPIRVASR
jgi:UrcA family protein